MQDCRIFITRSVEPAIEEWLQPKEILRSLGQLALFDVLNLAFCGAPVGEG